MSDDQDPKQPKMAIAATPEVSKDEATLEKQREAALEDEKRAAWLWRQAIVYVQDALQATREAEGLSSASDSGHLSANHKALAALHEAMAELHAMEGRSKQRVMLLKKKTDSVQP